MPRIVVWKITSEPSGDRHLGEVSFERSPFRIGRALDNDLRIRDPAVSRYHAEIVRDDESEWKVVNKSRRDALVVGGIFVAAHFLGDGEEVVIRPKYKLTFHRQDESQPPSKSSGSLVTPAQEPLVGPSSSSHGKPEGSKESTDAGWSRLTTALHTEAPKFIRGYRIVRLIDIGGMGIVYRATLKEWREHVVALKVIKDELLVWKKARDWFLREIEYSLELDHPNIVRVHYADLDESGRPFYVMQYLDGIALDDYVEKHKPSTDQLILLFHKIASAVGYAHREHDLVHRDIKPNNVMVTVKDGEPHLLDFGLACKDPDLECQKKEDASRTESAGPEGPFGAEAWRSPEHFEADIRKITARSDVYCLGVCMFKLLTGRFPYPIGLGPAMLEDAIRHQPPTDPSTLVPGLKDELRWIILRCLRKDPRDRYRDAAELADDIGRFMGNRPLLPPYPRPGLPRMVYAGRKRLWLHRRAAIWSVVGLVMVAVAALVGRSPPIPPSENLKAILQYFQGKDWSYAAGVCGPLADQFEDPEVYNDPNASTRVQEWRTLGEQLGRMPKNGDLDLEQIHAVCLCVLSATGDCPKHVDPNSFVGLRREAAGQLLATAMTDSKAHLDGGRYAEAFHVLKKGYDALDHLQESDRTSWSIGAQAAVSRLTEHVSRQLESPSAHVEVSELVAQAADSLRGTSLEPNGVVLCDKLASDLQVSLDQDLSAKKWPQAAGSCRALLRLGDYLDSTTAAACETLANLLKEIRDKLREDMDPETRDAPLVQLYRASDAAWQGAREPAKRRFGHVRDHLASCVLRRAKELQAPGKWGRSLEMLAEIGNYDGYADEVDKLTGSAEDGRDEDVKGERALGDVKHHLAAGVKDPNVLTEITATARTYKETAAKTQLAAELAAASARLFDRAIEEKEKPSVEERDWSFIEKACLALLDADKALVELGAEPRASDKVASLLGEARESLKNERLALEKLAAIRDLVDTGHAESKELLAARDAANAYAHTRCGPKLAECRDALRSMVFREGTKRLEEWHWDAARTTFEAVCDCNPSDDLGRKAQEKIELAASGASRGRQAEQVAKDAQGRVAKQEYGEAERALEKSLKATGDTPNKAWLEQLHDLAAELPSVHEFLKEHDLASASAALSQLAAKLTEPRLSDAKRTAQSIARLLAQLNQLGHELRLLQEKDELKALSEAEQPLKAYLQNLGSAVEIADHAQNSLVKSIAKKTESEKERLSNEATSLIAYCGATRGLAELERLVRSKGDLSAVHQKEKNLDATVKPLDAFGPADRAKHIRDRLKRLVSKAEAADAGCQDVQKHLSGGDYEAARKAADEAEKACADTWLLPRAQELLEAAENHGFESRVQIEKESVVAAGQKWEYVNTIGMKFMKIPALPLTESGPLYVAVYEATNHEFRKLIDGHDSGKTAPLVGESLNKDRQPVVRVSWTEARDFCERLTKKEKDLAREQGLPTPWVYRLPTSEEWEHACRAGELWGKFCFGNDLSKLKDYAWYNENSGSLVRLGRTRDVGGREPNAWGLYDMHGNAREWTLTRHPWVPEKRVIRGGCWSDVGGFLAADWRDEAQIPRHKDEMTGFRVIRVRQAEPSGAGQPTTPASQIRSPQR